jgi:hypothetical protein
VPISPSGSGTRAAFAGSPQVQEEGSGSLLAALIDPKAAQDRDGDLSVGRALQRQEGIGAGSLAPDLTVAGKVLSRTMAIHTSASKLDSRRYASRSSLLTINPHIGLVMTPQNATTLRWLGQCSGLDPGPAGVRDGHPREGALRAHHGRLQEYLASALQARGVRGEAPRG